MSFFKKVSKIVAVSLVLSFFAFGKDLVFASCKQAKSAPIVNVMTISKCIAKDQWKKEIKCLEVKDDGWYFFSLPISIPVKPSASKFNIHFYSSNEAASLCNSKKNLLVATLATEYPGKCTISNKWVNELEQSNYVFTEIEGQEDSWVIKNSNNESMYIIEQIDSKTIILKSRGKKLLYKFEVARDSVPQEVFSKIVALFSVKDHFENS